MDDNKDYKFSCEPKIWLSGENEFSIKDLLYYSDGAFINAPRFFQCEYCHKKITVNILGLHNVPRYVEEEAFRLAKIQHLRTEHTHKPQTKKEPH